MQIKFKCLTFEIADGKVSIRRFGKTESKINGNFVEVQIAGENKMNHMGAKMANSSEGVRLSYVSHELGGNSISITQRSELIKAKTTFESLADANAVRVYTEITNISNEAVTLEEVSAFVLPGIGDDIGNVEGLYYTRFVQSHHTECQPKRLSFADLGFHSDPKQPESQKRISCSNVGSWSTKEELPQGIIEDANKNSFIMFQIESNNSWYYEISDRDKEFYLWLGGANLPFGSWSKSLNKGETYRTPNVAVAVSDSLNGVLGEMTKYRRAICGLAEADKALPTIFNEYMHLSWDSPTEENTAIYAPVLAKTGVEYYVIDCGWHNEEPGDQVYPYVGQWKESHARFPKGVRATTDFIRSLGMKAGLWIEPEVVGIHCKEMLDYYGDDCFIKRYGKKIAVKNRYFLDYRHPKVIDYMSETIRRMVEDYGADYIKFDYNRDMGVGTDVDCLTPGEGLELCSAAFLDWFDEMRKRFPNVVFEGCASGGMRMDYRTLSSFSLISTSDQTNYLQYPYIAGNILSAVIPEQAAVWSYPVGECTKEEINDDQIVMNMINSFLGRMHLASHLEWMNEHQLGLVREGVEYYNSISPYKHNALPYLPCGFTGFGDEKVVSGFKSGNKIFLAVWTLTDKTDIDITLDDKISNVKLAYPLIPNAEYSASANKLSIKFHRGRTAAFFEIDC